MPTIELGTNTGRSSDAAFAREMQKLLKDLLHPHPLIFWTDMLTSAIVGYGALWLYVTAPLWSLWQFAGFVVAGLALYRSMMFTHELAHLPTGTFNLFHVTWNLIIGIPLMNPSFLYAEHRTHHVNHSYGTKGDAEYIPIGRGPLVWVVAFVLQGVLMPLLAVFRFGVLGPVSLLHPRFRRLVWERASGLTQNNSHFRRPLPQGRQWLYWGLQEAGCFVVCVGLATLTVIGVIPWSMLAKLYVLFAAVATLSYLRALASHLYWHEGDQMSYLDQMLDSTTIPGHPLLTELWAPLGQRYHALHHVFPSIPYHWLGVAHRRLMRELPVDAPYRKTVRRSLLKAISEMFTRARKAKFQRSEGILTS